MNTEDTLLFRDEIIIGGIVHSFPEQEQERIRSIVRQAVQRAAEGWVRDILPILAGSTESNAEIARLKQDCSQFYQAVCQVINALGNLSAHDIGCLNRLLDNVKAATRGEPRPHEDLLPFLLDKNNINKN